MDRPLTTIEAWVWAGLLLGRAAPGRAAAASAGMRYLDLCAGAGGASLGLQRAGLQPVGHYEWDRDACECMAASELGPKHVRWADLRQVQAHTLPAAEVWWASPPCQPFSAAGQRQANDDERNLYPTVLRLVRDALELGRGPRWLLVENVVGLTHHSRKYCLQRGGTGPCAGCYWEGEILPGLRRLFPHVDHRTLNTADYGVPQTRRRVITVCGPEPYRWPAPTHSEQGDLLTRPWVTMAEALDLPVPPCSVEGGGHNPTHRPAWWYRESDPAAPSRTIGTKGNAQVTVWGRTGGPSPTVSATEVKGATLSGPRLRGEGDQPARVNRASDALLLQTGRRRLTVQECAILQGFPPDWPFHGTKKAQYRQVGNAVPPPLAEVLGQAMINHEGGS